MKVPLSKLKHHPLNERIYSLSGIESLMESISQVGLLEPPTIDQHFQVVSGNRRFESVKRLGWNEIDVHQIHVKKGDEVLTLIHFNRQRVKTTQELLNEYFELESYHKEKGLEKGKKVRNVVSKEIKVNDSHLARILYIHKRNPKYIELIDQGILTTNQAYLNLRREEEEKISRESKKETSQFKLPSNGNEFTFYNKSSDKLLEIDNNSIQTIFTSPPYFSVRSSQYTKKVLLGNERSVDEYAENLSNHLISCYRVLKENGSFYLNLGDCYIDGELQSAPHKVLFKLLDKTDFILRSTIIFRKTNPKPSSIKNRPTNSFEYVFHLVKSMNYDYERLILPLSSNTKASHPPRHRSKKGDNKIIIGSPYIPSSGKNLPDFWDDDIIVTSVANQSLNYGTEHPAMYHPSLVTIPILQTCVLPWLNILDRSEIRHKILDPFTGANNTYKAMKWINETYGCNLEFIGYDLKKYF